MTGTYRHISVERQGDVFFVRLLDHRMDEPDILEMADELTALITDEGCLKMILSLGPGEMDCLYSVFIAKLVMVRRHLVERGGSLVLAEATPNTIGVFEACQLKDFFRFAPDRASAVATL